MAYIFRIVNDKGTIFKSRAFPMGWYPSLESAMNAKTKYVQKRYDTFVWHIEATEVNWYELDRQS